MHVCYKDILARIPDHPIWWDENAVPRFSPFAPTKVANIYAEEVALVEIECQNCHRSFQVAFSSWGIIRSLARNLAEDILHHAINYGDPPNLPCCASGPTMSSTAKRVLEFWVKNKAVGFKWVRVPSLEIEINGKVDQ